MYQPLRLHSSHLQVQFPVSHGSHKLQNLKGPDKLAKAFNLPRWVVFLITMLLKITGLVISCGGYIGKFGPTVPFKDISGEALLVPYTSREFSVSGLYCQSISLSRFFWDNSAADWSWNATVAVVNELPPTEIYNFSLTKSLTLHDGEHWYMRHFYLHAGSEIFIRSCVLQGDTEKVHVCLIKGDGAFIKWQASSYSCQGVHTTDYSLGNCTGDHFWNSSYIFSANGTDTYYIIHYTATESSEEFDVLMNVSIASSCYDLVDSNISCTTSSYDSCTTGLPIPYNYRGFAVVTANNITALNSSIWSFEDAIKISWKCNPSWTGFILVTGIPFLFIILCTSLLCLGCCVCPCRKRSGRERERLIPQSTPDKLSKLKKGYVFIHICFAKGLLIVAAVFTFLVVFFTITAHDFQDNMIFSPADTRVFPVNTLFCSELSVKINAGSSHLSAMAKVADQEPEKHSVLKSVKDKFVCGDSAGCYVVWRSHMNSGSTLNISAVNYGASDAFLIWYEDDYSFQEFINSDNKSKYTSQSCIFEAYNVTHHPLPPMNGDYYFFLFSNNRTNVTFSLDFNDVEYKTNTSSFSCNLHSYTTTSCTMSVPFGVGNIFGLIEVTSDDENSRYMEYLTVSADYKFRWIIVIPFGLIVLVVLFLPLYFGISVLHHHSYKANVSKIKRDAEPSPSPSDSSNLEPRVSPTPSDESPPLNATPLSCNNDSSGSNSTCSATPARESPSSAGYAAAVEVQVEIHPGNDEDACGPAAGDIAVSSTSGILKEDQNTEEIHDADNTDSLLTDL